MTAVYHIVTQKDSDIAFITSGKTLLDVPITITSLLFLSKFLKKKGQCKCHPATEENQLRLDANAFKISSRDVHLFQDLFSKEKGNDRYKKYLHDLKVVAEGAAPFFGANAYEIQFPSALYAKYADEIEEFISIVSEDSTIVTKGLQLTKSVIDIGKDKLLRSLLNVGKKKKVSETGKFGSLIKGNTILSPLITYYNVELL